MLSQKQQDIVIEAMKPFKPTKIAFSPFDAFEEEIELLYDFDECPSLLELARIIVSLEKQFNQKVNLISFDMIHPFIKQDMLNEATIFFDEGKRAKADSI
ncbi:MAG: nucleotidyltransferase [Flavobacteriaceae bacterium]|nr:nucleotidyltransferase [Flavobacteriaceae bacterium]